MAQRKRELERPGSGISMRPQGGRERGVRGGPPLLPDRDAQQRVIAEIVADMAADIPMHRLLQGDVGSGKTRGRGGRSRRRPAELAIRAR